MAETQNQQLPDWFLQALGIGGGLGSAAGGLFNVFGGGGKNPATQANKYLDQIPGQVSPYYQPYQQAGNEALGNVQNEYGKLTNNPGEFYNQLASGYQESPGYKFQLNRALGAGNNAAAMGGYLGTPQHQESNMEIAQGLTSKDYEDYLNHVMGLYGQGLQGQQGISNQGFQANTDYGNLLAQLQNAKANYAFAGQAGQNAARSSGLGDIFSGLGTAAASFVPGGGLLKHLFGG